MVRRFFAVVFALIGLACVVAAMLDYFTRGSISQPIVMGVVGVACIIVSLLIRYGGNDASSRRGIQSDGGKVFSTTHTKADGSPAPEVWFNNVAGVTFKNDDGTPRQRIVKKCKGGERLVLRRDPDNEHDQFAVAVHRANGDQIGFIPSDSAEWMGRCMDEGHEFWAEVKEVTGQGRDTLGVNIRVGWKR